MVLIGQYSWEDHGEIIRVLIPLKGISPSKVDIQGILL